VIHIHYVLIFLPIPDPGIKKAPISDPDLQRCPQYTLLCNPALNRLPVYSVYHVTDSPEGGDLLLVLNTELLSLLAVLHHVAADIDSTYREKIYK
jgi:hypothetical protein